MISKLYQQKESKAIEGICGRLGDLGTIDSKYDVAVTTACGALDSIVVDTVECGQNCIKYLKSNNLGRATFLCLDKLFSNNIKRFPTPENVPRLFDLIKVVDKRFENVFYHSLQDTLVAKDLDQANRIAYGKQRYRVVTLDGQIIDKAGTMSGGGNRVLKGGMSSSSVSLQDVSKLEAEANELEANYNSLTSQLKLENAALDNSKVQLGEIATELQKCELDLKSYEGELKDAENALEQAKENKTPNPEDVKQLKGLERRGTEIELELAKLRNSTTGIEKELNDLQDQIMQVGGVRFRTQKGKVDSLKEQIDHIQNKITKSAAEKVARERNLTKIDAKIEKKELALQTLTAEIEALEEKQSKLLASSKGIKSESKDARDLLEAKEEELKEAKDQLGSLNKAAYKVKSKLLELNATINSSKQNIKNYSQKVKQCDSELESLEIQKSGFEDMDKTELVQFSEPELASFNLKSISSEIEKLKSIFKFIRSCTETKSKPRSAVRISR